MIEEPFDDYVSAQEAPLFAEAEGGKKSGELLWGDGVRRLNQTSGDRVKVRARGREGEGARA